MRLGKYVFCVFLMVRFAPGFGMRAADHVAFG